MNDRQSHPLMLLVSFTWTMLLCAIGLLLAVNVLRSIWPWLLGVVLAVLLLVVAVRLLLWRRGRSW